MKQTARPRYRMLRLMLPLFLFLFGCFTPQPPPPIGPSADEANVAILGDVDRLAPGSQASFLVQARVPYSMQRWPDATVEVYLNGPDGSRRRLFSGITGPDGIANVNFAVPADLASPQQELEILTQFPADENGYIRTASTYRSVHIGRAYNVLVATDKPVYQPGQAIHIRGLGLDALDMHAAGGMTMTVTVADPQGNKLLRKELSTSPYGIASADFPLDTQAPSGDYTVTAEMGPAASTRSVEVKPYSLPRFEVTFHPDRTFYLPGETATGAVEAHYFFGKPVAEGQVSIVGTLDDGGGERTVFELDGATDSEGRYTYAFAVPDSVRGQLDNKSIDVELEITVIDTADHSESIDDSVTVAEKTLLIDAVPESGRLRRGLDDLVYLDVTYPDGVAAQAVLTVTDAYSQTFHAATDAYGQAVITLTTPNDGLTPLVVTAADARGNMVEQPLLLGTEEGNSTASLLLRPARAEYRVGDTLDVDIFVDGDVENVYVDIIKDRQTFGMAALPVSSGVARAAIDIDGSLLGTLELNAYTVDPAGQIARDRRYVLVNPAPAEVSVNADKAEYRPGETAVLDIQVSRNQQPQQAAVGVSIVDESVYAIEDVDSRFARTYFLLNRELQEPRYGIHDFVDLESGDPSPYDDAPDSVRYAGAAARQIALAGAFAEVLAKEAAAQTRIDGAKASQPLDPWALASAWGNRLYLGAPLLGLALYDGSRNRRRLLIGLVVFSLGAFVWGACGAPAAAPAPAAAEQQALEGTTTATRGEKPPRLRQFFPETLYWMPELVTDDQGRAQIEVPVADSITTWRASLLVSDKQGNLGSAELGLRAFQDFFIEPDLPRFLTVGDEIDVPIAVYNYLAEPQSIELAVTPGDWFEVRGEPQMVLEAGANEVLAAYLPIRVTQFGNHKLQIAATGSSMSDAVLREVEVLPNGQRAVEVTGGRMAASQQITLSIPANAIPATSRVTVKVYPGIVSQVLAGLEGMLQMPYGCFEQTSSATYPNVLVRDYLKRTGQASPRVEMQADYLISQGYQRLIGFEVDGVPGGFSLFGDPPADTMLTAYGLLEFGDMSEVAYVDPDLLARMADFLAERQNRDGSWDAYGAGVVSGDPTSTDYRLATTAYIAWGLADAGYADDRVVRAAVRYLERSFDRLEDQATGSSAPPPSENDTLRATVEAAEGLAPADTPQPQGKLSTYTLALVANALLAGGGDAAPVIDQMLARAERDTGLVYWSPGTETYLGSYGTAGTIEVTGIAAQALLRSESALDVAQQALDFLIANRDPNGSFYTTQATIQALKALLLASSAAETTEDANVSVTYIQADGTQATQTIAVEASNADVIQQVVLENVAPGAVLSLAADGERQLQYQVVSEYYLPWEEATAMATVQAPMRIAVTYDRSELGVDEMLGVRADVELLTGDTAGTVIVDLGLPPGFAPVTGDLDALVASGQIDRYELTGRQILLYLTNVASGQVYTFEYRLQARYPLAVQAPSSQVYDYYAPDQRASETPQRIVVTLGTP